MTDSPKKIAILIISLAFVALITTGFIVFFTVFYRPAPKEISRIETAPKQPLPFSQEEKNLPTSSIRVFNPDQEKIKPLPEKSETEEISMSTTISSSTFEVPVMPLPRPVPEQYQPDLLSDLPPIAEDFFRRIQRAADAAEEKIEQRQVSTPSQPLPGASGQEITITEREINLPFLSKKEFDSLYPDYFINSLQDAQKLLAVYDPNYKPLDKIETDTDVRYIQEKIIAALFSANMLTKEEAESALTTIRFTLPQLQLIDLGKEILKKQETNKFSVASWLENLFSVAIQGPKFFISFLSEEIFSKRANAYSFGSLLPPELIEKFWQSIIPVAESAGGPCGFCFILPECFQFGGSSPLPGPVFFKSFCYCTGCLFGQGCLDTCVGRAAIWDSPGGLPPTTMLCGCAA